jgi:hypothetical protein
MPRCLAVLASTALLSGLGCASGGGGGSSGGSSAEPPAAAKPAAAKPADVPPPANSKLAKVTLGMTDSDVRKALGEPTSTKEYMSGKAWIPWGTEGSRSEWTYKGEGLVVFGRNRYSGGLKVIRVLYDPKVGG